MSVRNSKAIQKSYDESWEKVAWNRHQVIAMEVEDGKRDSDSYFIKGVEAAKRIEAKYGIDDLMLDDFEFGLLSGKMSALAWVLGSEWEGSLDT